MADERIINTRLKEARKKAGLTQKELGDKVGLSPQTISTYEIDKYPTADMLVNLAEALNVSVAWLCGEEELKEEKRTTLADILAEIETLEKMLGSMTCRPHGEIAFTDIPEELADALDDREQLQTISNRELREKSLSYWRSCTMAALETIEYPADINFLF